MIRMLHRRISSLTSAVVFATPCGDRMKANPLRLFRTTIMVVCVIAATSIPADAGLLFMRGSGPVSGPPGGGFSDITENVVANQFTINSDFSLGSAKVLLDDVDALVVGGSRTDGVFDGFSGTVGWSVYADNSGSVGTQLAYGQDTNTLVEDTGVDWSNGTFTTDIFSVLFDFTSPTFGDVSSLTSGTYWFAIREGNWGAAADTTRVRWQTVGETSGSGTSPYNRLSYDEDSITPGLTYTNGVANGFSVFDSVPEPSTFALTGCGALALLVAARRRTTRQAIHLATLVALFVGLPSVASAVTIPTVPVGNAGNAADTTGYGAVTYDYRIGTTEVTNAQYVAFLKTRRPAISPDWRASQTTVRPEY